MRILFLLTCTLFSFALSAQELVMNLPTDEKVVMQIGPDDSFLSVMETIKEQIDSQEFLVDLFFSDTIHVSKSKPKKTVVRNYFAPLAAAEREDIRYILRTLANNSLIKIAGYKSSLNKAGDRVNHVHPFRFLECIFADDELKVCARNIQGKTWVWSGFLDGVITSFNEEIKVNNVRPEFLADFAAIVKVDVNHLLPAYHSHNWEHMVNVLIAHVPKTVGLAISIIGKINTKALLVAPLFAIRHPHQSHRQNPPPSSSSSSSKSSEVVLGAGFCPFFKIFLEGHFDRYVINPDR